MNPQKIVLSLFLLFIILLSSCKNGEVNELREFDVDTPEVRIHVRMAGSTDKGCVLIAINGGPGLTSSYMWDLEQLAGDDCAVVTYDQRGLGKSTDPKHPDSQASYSLRKYAQDLEAIRQEIGVERVHLMGHSFGGLVIMQYLANYPEHIASLIFYGSGPPTWEGIKKSQQNFSDRLISMIQDGILSPPEEWEEDGVDPLLPVYFSDPAYTFPADARGKPPDFNQRISDLTYPNLVEMDFRKVLAESQQPVLLMFGKDDPFGLQMAESLRDALAAAEVEYVLIDQCGHFWHECADDFYPRVEQFLAENSQ